MLFNCFLKISCFEPSVAYKKGCSSKRVKTTKGAFPLKNISEVTDNVFLFVMLRMLSCLEFLSEEFR